MYNCLSNFRLRRIEQFVDIFRKNAPGIYTTENTSVESSDQRTAIDNKLYCTYMHRHGERHRKIPGVVSLGIGAYTIQTVPGGNHNRRSNRRPGLRQRRSPLGDRICDRICASGSSALPGPQSRSRPEGPLVTKSCDEDAKEQQISYVLSMSLFFVDIARTALLVPFFAVMHQISTTSSSSKVVPIWQPFFDLLVALFDLLVARYQLYLGYFFCDHQPANWVRTSQMQ